MKRFTCSALVLVAMILMLPGLAFMMLANLIEEDLPV